MKAAIIERTHEGVTIRYPDSGLRLLWLGALLPWLIVLGVHGLEAALRYTLCGAVPLLALAATSLLRFRRELRIDARQLTYTTSSAFGAPRVEQASLREVKCLGVRMSADHVPYIELRLPSGLRLALPAETVKDAVSLARDIRAQSAERSRRIDRGDVQDIPADLRSIERVIEGDHR